MRFTVIGSLACAFMASTVLANNCKKGLYYCGAGLLRKGNYYNQISGALAAAGQSQDSNYINNSLFFCVNDDNGNGNIIFVTFCSLGCQDAGSGNSDYCRYAKKTI